MNNRSSLQGAGIRGNQCHPTALDSNDQRPAQRETQQSASADAPRRILRLNARVRLTALIENPRLCTKIPHLRSGQWSCWRVPMVYCGWSRRRCGGCGVVGLAVEVDEHRAVQQAIKLRSDHVGATEDLTPGSHKFPALMQTLPKAKRPPRAELNRMQKTTLSPYVPQTRHAIAYIYGDRGPMPTTVIAESQR